MKIQEFSLPSPPPRAFAVDGVLASNYTIGVPINLPWATVWLHQPGQGHSWGRGPLGMRPVVDCGILPVGRVGLDFVVELPLFSRLVVGGDFMRQST